MPRPHGANRANDSFSLSPDDLNSVANTFAYSLTFRLGALDSLVKRTCVPWFRGSLRLGDDGGFSTETSPESDADAENDIDAVPLMAPGVACGGDGGD